MQNSPNPLPHARWRLRIVLSVALLALVLTGAGLEATNHKSTPPATTVSSTTSTVASPSTSTDPTTTTTRPTTSTSLQSLVSEPLTLNEPAHGCGFAMITNSRPTATTTTPTSTFPSTTTSTSGTTTTTSATTTSGTTATTRATTTTSTSDVVPVRVIGHCTVLEIGDSLGNDLGWGLARELASTHALKLVQKDKSASGLVTTWFYNWHQHLKTLLKQYHPDLVIVCVGGDDEQGMKVNGHVYGFNSPPWRARYSALIRQIDTTTTSAGSYVLWVGLPIMEPNIYREGAKTLNSLYRSMATTVPGVTYLPSWALFANTSGQFEMAASVNHVRTVLRSTDGIHLSYVGENVFATFVANEMATIYHVTLNPSQPASITK